MRIKYFVFLLKKKTYRQSDKKVEFSRNFSLEKSLRKKLNLSKGNVFYRLQYFFRTICF